jgi:hypothetical protein
MTTMLQLVQQVCDEMGLAHPNTVAGSANQDLIQILALINATGYELLHAFDWQGLVTEYRFTTSYSSLAGTTTNGSAIVTGISSTSGLDSNYAVSGTGLNQDTYISTVDSSTQVTLTQAASASGTATLLFSKTKYALPSDYDRLTARTLWDKSKRWEMVGAETAQQWQWLKSGYIAVGPRLRFRILSGYFQIWPLLNTNEYLGWEYISKNWARSSGGTAQSSFTADTDTCIYRDRLMVLGTKKKYFEVKGFDSSNYARDFMSELLTAIAQEQAPPTLSQSPNMANVLIGYSNIPDGGYGS